MEACIDCIVSRGALVLLSFSYYYRNNMFCAAHIIFSARLILHVVFIIHPITANPVNNRRYKVTQALK